LHTGDIAGTHACPPFSLLFLGKLSSVGAWGTNRKSGMSLPRLARD
jgi:hypothetical protein